MAGLVCWKSGFELSAARRSDSCPQRSHIKSNQYFKLVLHHVDGAPDFPREIVSERDRCANEGRNPFSSNFGQPALRPRQSIGLPLRRVDSDGLETDAGSRVNRMLQTACCLVGFWIGVPAFGGALRTNEVLDVFPSRPIEWLPAPVALPVRPLRFPPAVSVQRVENLVVAGGKVWMVVALRGGGTNSAKSTLWAFSPVDGRLDPVRGQVEHHSIRDLRVGPEGIWMAVDGGAAVLDPQTLVVDAFSSGHGLTTGNLAAFAGAGRRWFGMSDAGVLFGLHPDGRSWSRLPGSPGLVGKDTLRYGHLAGSGEWLLGMSDGEIVLRHHAASSWETIDPKQWQGLPVDQPIHFQCVVEDGDGGFWVGSDLGLHFVAAETGSVRHQLATRTVRVPGGLGIDVPAGFQPSSAAYQQARRRQADGIRERMRLRARLGRKSVEIGQKLDPVSPKSRIAGGVRGMVRDGAFVWVACEDPATPLRTRLILWHGSSRRWVGQFAVSLPVTQLAVDAQHLWLGTDLGMMPNGAPVLVVEKMGLMAVPAARWVPDEIGAEEMERRLGELPVREQAVRAFFSGNAGKVVELLGAEGTDAESLFLLAFAHDPLGLDDAVKREAYLARLKKDFPESPYGEVVRGLKPVVKTDPLVAAGGSVLQTLFKRRDVNGDGRISDEEWKEWKGAGADMKAFDVNGDGFLGVEEFDAVLRGTSR